MQSPESPAMGLYVITSITLCDDSKSTVKINIKFNKIKKKPVISQIWFVTQAVIPKAVYLNYSSKKTVKPVILRGKISDKNIILRKKINMLEFKWPQLFDSKIGVMAKQLIGVYEDYIFVQSLPYIKTGVYPEYSNCQIYVNPQFNMLEYESLSPAQSLSKGNTMSIEIYWNLMQCRKGNYITEKEYNHD